MVLWTNLQGNRNPDIEKGIGNTVGERRMWLIEREALKTYTSIYVDIQVGSCCETASLTLQLSVKPEKCMRVGVSPEEEHICCMTDSYIVILKILQWCAGDQTWKYPLHPLPLPFNTPLSTYVFHRTFAPPLSFTQEPW